MTTKHNRYTKHLVNTSLVLLLLLAGNTAMAQKWLPGHFVDVKGVTTAGYIYPNPGGRGPFRDEGFIEFKDEEHSTPYYLSARDLQSFVAGRDSFVVAHAPGNETWAKREFDFVRVAIDEPIKIYATRGAGNGGSGGGKKVSVSPELGIGTGTYGTSYGGGVGINIGGGGGGGNNNKLSYYYGSSTATMQHLTNENFVDIMSEVMADEPEVVEQIRANHFGIKNIEKLIAYFYKVRDSHR
jgi:hypothetical protein